MSHHLDSPLASQNGQLYLNDLFVFNGDRGTVFIMDVNTSVGGGDIPAGFHHEGRYEFKVHFDSNPFEDLTFRIAFEEPDSNGQQALTLHSLAGPEARDDGATGTFVLQGRTGDMVTDNGTRIWAGRITDPFYVDLGQVGQINGAVRDGSTVDQSAWNVKKARNSFKGQTVQSIVLEISDQHPLLRNGARIGVWATTKLATDSGGWRQINRAGHPMMWPLFWPDDTRFTDDANTRHPSDDLSRDGQNIARSVAAVVAANGNSADPSGYGKTVAQTLYPDVLSYVVGTSATFGFAVRNGRTLADNAPEVMISLVLNQPISSGLGPDTSESARDNKFPYVVAG